MSSLRNFGIAFLVALLILSFAAYFAVGLAADLFEESIQNQQNAGTDDIKKYEGNISDNMPDPIKVGHSFNAVVIGTDYDPVVYDDYLPPKEMVGYLHVTRKVKVTTILFVRFDKENRTLILSNIPAETKVSIDFVEMTLGDAYSYRGAQFIKESVGNYTGLSVDYMFEFSGREFTEYIYRNMRGLSTYLCPIDLDTDDSKGLSPASFKKGEIISTQNDLYTLLHHNSYTLENVSKKYRLTQDIFLQTLKKLISADGDAMFKKLLPLTNDLPSSGADKPSEPSGEVKELLEVVNALAMYLDDKEFPTTVKTVNLYMYGDYSAGVFSPDIAKIRELFSDYRYK